MKILTTYHWAQWFERALSDRNKPRATMAVMAWIYVHADSEGEGFGIDEQTMRDIAYEVSGHGSPEVSEVMAAVAYLQEMDYIELPEKPDLDAKVVLNVIDY
jgi:hypothetical protein